MRLENYIDGIHAGLLELEEQEETLYKLIDKISNTRGTTYIFGNGGSASTASHFARDLSYGTKLKLKAQSLTDLTKITAFGNDKGYNYIFSEQLKDRITKEDIAVGISASGNSKNVIYGILKAKVQKAFTIGILGFGGGELEHKVDLSIVFSSTNYKLCEDLHLITCHVICELLEKLR